MLREQVSPFRPARMSAQIMPIGVRDIVLPPIPTESPSLTNEVASSSETTLSRRLRSRRDSSSRSSRYVGAALPVSLVAAMAISMGELGANLPIEFIDQAIPPGNAV